MRPHSVNSSSGGGSSSQHHPMANNNPFNEKLSAEIRSEIQRFESVHPCIYTVYDLIEAIEDVALQEQLREQVVNIEDAFVNSQEWTLSRGVHELRLGIVGSLSSGKSSLVHYFLTGTGTTEESPEGGRFKKQVMVGGRSYLLLIRDEGSQQPEAQFTHWLDAVLVVYAVESRESYQTALYYHRRMTGYRGMCIGDVPVLLVGTTQGSSSSNDDGGASPRAVSEEEARQASGTLKMCDYYECSPAPGQNVEGIFHNVCQRIVQHRYRSGLTGAGSVPRTPTASLGNSNSVGVASYDRHSQPSTQLHHHGGNNGGGGEPYTHSLSHIASAGNHPYYSHRERYQRHQYPRVQDCFQPPPPPPPPTAEGPPRPLGESSRQQNTSSASTFFQNDPPAHPSRLNHHPGTQRHAPPASIGRHSAAQQCQSTSNFSTFLMPSAKNTAPGPAPSTSNGHDRASTGPVSPSQLGGYYARNNGGSSLLQHYSRSTSNVLMPTSSVPLDGRERYHPPYHHRGSLVDPSASSYNNPSYLLMDDEEYSTAASSTTLVHTQSSGGGRQPTPSSTPNTQRKNRRISNLFRGSKEPREPPHHDLHASNGHLLLPHSALAEAVRGGVSKSSAAGIHMGVGRAIPIKQGLLYKRSAKALNREWKKKYVCLYPDGRLCYHSSLKDYMDRDSRAKEIYLGLATVKVSGRRGPKGVVPTTSATSNRHSLMPSASASAVETSDAARNNEAVTPTTAGEGTSGVSDSDFGASGGGNGSGGGLLLSSTSSGVLAPSDKSKAATAVQLTASGGKAKKKGGGHKRGGGLKNGGGDGGGEGEDGEGSCEFEVISCDQKRWEFSAATSEERDDWVRLIEQQIGRCLQSQVSQKQQQQQHGWNGGANSGEAGGNGAPQHSARREVEALRRVSGNQRCAECSAPDPQWASLNLGTLVCIECSGIHRNLGTHLSKVRSLELDDWPAEYLCVMRAIGNALAAQVWEHDAPDRERPSPDSSHEQKERWIRMKYEQRRFLAPMPPSSSSSAPSSAATISQQLVQSVLQRDLRSLLALLPRCTEAELNSTISASDKRTPLHLACSMGAPELLQLLLWAGADAKAVDENGRTALWHTRLSGSRECTSILTNLGVVNEATEDATTGSTTTSMQAKTPRRVGQSSATTTPDISNGIAAAFESLPASAI